LEVTEALEASIVVVQLPPSFHYSQSHLASMTDFFKRTSTRTRLAVEFGHSSCYPHFDRVAELLRDNGVIIVTDPLKGQSVH